MQEVEKSKRGVSDNRKAEGRKFSGCWQHARKQDYRKGRDSEYGISFP